MDAEDNFNDNYVSVDGRMATFRTASISFDNGKEADTFTEVRPNSDIKTFDSIKDCKEFCDNHGKQVFVGTKRVKFVKVNF